MGIVVDFSQSTINVESDPEILNQLKPAIGPITNRVLFPMSSFEARFAFRFDPKQGYPPPNQTGSCRIGIVQNVLFAKLTVAYQGGLKKELKYAQRVVDCGDDSAFPFYNVPGSVTRSGSSKNMFPYRWISYNAKGFGEVLDPWAPAGDNIVLQASSDVSLVDQPFFKVKLRSRNDALLSEATQILTFGMWLVAIPSDGAQPHVFAHADPFSLLYTSKFTTRGQLLSIGTPDATFKVRVKKGRAASVHEFGATQGLRISSGSGTIQPVVKGPTAQAKDEEWQDALLAM